MASPSGAFDCSRVHHITAWVLHTGLCQLCVSVLHQGGGNKQACFGAIGGGILALPHLKRCMLGLQAQRVRSAASCRPSHVPRLDEVMLAGLHAFVLVYIYFVVCKNCTYDTPTTAVSGLLDTWCFWL
jgi:hypothetical protein